MMNGTMKRKVGRIVVAVLAALSLTACGKKAVCSFCGEEKSCQTKTVFGEELYICRDFEKELSGN